MLLLSGIISNHRTYLHRYDLYLQDGFFFSKPSTPFEFHFKPIHLEKHGKLETAEYLFLILSLHFSASGSVHV